MSNTILRPAITALAAAGVASTILLVKTTSIHSTITSTTTIPTSFSTSHTAKSLVNPRNHTAAADTRSTTVQVKQGTTDEVILAKYLKGFFGGWVFTPERTILAAIKPSWVRYSKLERIEPPPHQIWSARDLSPEKLPPLHTILFGAFQVVDVHIDVDSDSDSDNNTNRPDIPTQPRNSHSYIDVAYGSDMGGFAGVHRFSIRRHRHRHPPVPLPPTSASALGASPDLDPDLTTTPTPGEQTVEIEIEFPSLTCNPTTDKPFAPEWTYLFHRTYATLLFKEGVRGVVTE